jgi:hypothetical protein
LQVSATVAFALRPKRRLERELRRLAKKQLESARESLRARAGDPAIHKARKRVKKLRAILRLVDDEPQADQRRDAEKMLRQAGHALSAMRDADVMIETFDALRERYPRRLSEHSYAIVRRHLVFVKSCSETQARRARLLARTAGCLRAVERSARRWPLPKLRTPDLPRLIKAAYREGRAEMKRAVVSNASVDVHRWRRRSKALWYDLRLLKELAPRVRPLADALKRLDALLGDDHNLHVLAAELSSQASLRPNPGVDKVIALAFSEQAKLRSEAFDLGRRLFGMRPKEFAAELDAYLRPPARRPRRFPWPFRRTSAA